jgi:hypothetical protein
MNEDALAARVRDAVGALGAPAYPAGAVARRIAAPARVTRRAIRPRAAFAAVAVALAAAGVAASAGATAPAVSEHFRALLSALGLPVKNARIVPARTVSLDEAKAAVPFSIIVPAGVRLVRTTLNEDASGYRSVDLVLGYGARSQIVLDESPAHDPHRTAEFEGTAIAVRRGSAPQHGGLPQHVALLSWRVGRTRLVMMPYDEASHAFAMRVRHDTLASRAP